MYLYHSFILNCENFEYPSFTLPFYYFTFFLVHKRLRNLIERMQRKRQKYCPYI